MNKKPQLSKTFVIALIVILSILVIAATWYSSWEKECHGVVKKEKLGENHWLVKCVSKVEPTPKPTATPTPEPWSPDPACMLSGVNARRDGQLTITETENDYSIVALFEIRGKVECWTRPNSTGYLKLAIPQSCGGSLWSSLVDGREQVDELWVEYGGVFNGSDEHQSLNGRLDCLGSDPFNAELDVTYHGPDPTDNYNTQYWQFQDVVILRP